MEHEWLLAAVLAAPDDDAPRLVYADWLDEYGEAADAERRRLLAVVDQWAGTPSNRPGGTREDGRRAGGALARAQSLGWAAGARERAEFIRVQCELERRFPPVRLMGATPRVCAPHTVDALDALQRRAGELLYGRAAGDWSPPEANATAWAPGALRHSGIGYSFCRGFVESVTCTAADWLSHGPAVVACQPVTRVTLSDRQPLAGIRPTRYAWFHSDVPGVPHIPQAKPPLELFVLLRGGFRSVPRCKWYDAEAEALADLSAAAILWARSARHAEANP